MAELSSGRPKSWQVAGVAAGNAVAFYDFVIYGFFARQIGAALFPTGHALTDLLASLAAFSAGFAARPIGAIVLGRVADGRGRKPAMQIAFLTMAAAMLGLGLLPSYDRIGAAAPVGAVLLRLLQGFAIGGDLGASTAFLCEAAPRRRRGLYISFQLSGQDAAILLSSAVGFTLASALSPGELAAWGWRVAFFGGGALLLAAYPLRRHLDETLAGGGSDVAPRTGAGIGGAILPGALILAESTTVTYVLIALPTYAATTLGFGDPASYVPAIAVGVVGVLVSPLSGALSDRFGRRPVMIAPAILLLLVALPGLRLATTVGGTTALVAWSVVVATCSALANTAALVSVTEMLPQRRRSTTIGLGYAVVVAIFGGTTPLLLTWLVRALAYPLVPGWYVTVAAAIGLAAMLRMPETAPIKAVRLEPAR